MGSGSGSGSEYRYQDIGVRSTVMGCRLQVNDTPTGC